MIRHIKVENNFQKYVLVAAIFHILLLVGFYFLQAILDLNLLKFREPPKKLEILTSAIKVDIVGMPKFTLRELQEIKLDQTTTERDIVEKQAVDSQTKNEDEFKVKAKKIKLNDILSEISQKKINTKSRTRKTKNDNQTALRQLVLEGNKVSRGASVAGELIEVKNQLFIEYVQKLPDQVRPHWKLPSYLMQQDLKCRIRVYISQNGAVLRTEVLERSGEDEYDQKALVAIKNAGPFLPPNKEIVSRVSSGQVVLGFPL